MSNRTRRLGRLYPTLTPRERVLIVLRAWKQRTQPDEAILSTMSTEDRRDFQRHLALAITANEQSSYIRLLREHVAVLEQAYLLIRTRRSMGNEIHVLGRYIREATREPATESEYHRREQDLRSALVPVRELVEIAIEAYADWTDADYIDDGGKRVLSEEAQARARAETERELVQLFRVGILTGEERTSGVFIHTSAFYDWFGEEVPILAESGDEYEIFPDSEAENVARRQCTRRLVDQLINGAPGGVDLPLDLEASPPDLVDVKLTSAALERVQVIALHNGIRGRWCDLRGFEVVMAEFAAKEFNGEDPLHVETSEILGEIRRRLLALREQVQVYAGDIELAEPDPDDVKRLRKSIKRRAKRR